MELVSEAAHVLLHKLIPLHYIQMFYNILSTVYIVCMYMLDKLEAVASF